VNLVDNKDALVQKIERWKRDLIDLTNRNVLLNFRPKKTNSLIIEEELQELFGKVVIESKGINPELIKTSSYSQVQMLENTDDDNELRKKKIEEERERFYKLLSKLRTAARTRLNEQGIQTLYLVFGVLKWREYGNDRDFIAPLLLVPVELNRQTANHPFSLRMIDDDIILNPFLAHKLKEEKGLMLPEIEDKEDIDIIRLLDSISEQICNIDGWAVLNKIYLSLFSFSKLIMYKDLENYRDLLDSHPLIRAISGEGESKTSSALIGFSDVPEVSSLDRVIPSEESFQILDADSSQHQAIVAAKKGVSFVLQGPPGTGKSQTISNMIAEFLAMNKKVLFVSEKMAALNVVKSRLEQVGLGDYCLELHSQKAKKRGVLDEFADIISKPNQPRNIDNNLYPKINSLRTDLNTYANSLHEIRFPLGKSVYEVHGILSKLDSVPEMLFDFNYNSDTNLDQIKNVLTEFERFRGQTIFVEQSPVWNGFKNSVFSLELASKVESLLRKSSLNLLDIIGTSIELQSNYGLESKSVSEFIRNIEILETAKYSPLPPKHWFYQDSIITILNDAKAYQEQMISFIEENNKLEKSFSGDILNLDLNITSDLLFSESEQLFSAIGESADNVLLLNKESIVKLLSTCINAFQVMHNYDEIRSEFGLNEIVFIEDFKIVAVYASVLYENPLPTQWWFDDIHKVSSVFNELKLKYAKVAELRMILFAKYEASVLQLDLFNLKQDLELRSSHIRVPFQTSTNEQLEKNIFSKRNFILDQFMTLRLLNEQFVVIKDDISKYIGITEVFNIKTVRHLKPFVEQISKDPRPQPIWFNLDRHHDVFAFIQQAKVVHLKYTEEFNSISELYEEEVFDPQIIDIADRFGNMHQSWKRNFSGKYNKDRKWLSSKLKQKSNYTFEELLKQVRSIKRLLEHKQWIDDKQSELRSLLGWHYKGLSTNWDLIEKSFENVKNIMEFSFGSSISADLKDLLVNPASRLEQLVSNYNRIFIICNKFEEIITILKQEFPHLFDMWRTMPVDNWPLQDVTRFVEDIRYKLESFYYVSDLIIGTRKLNTATNISILEITQDIDLALTLTMYQNELNQNETTYKDYFGSRYNSDHNSWEQIEKSIFNFNKLLLVSNSIPQRFRDILIKGTGIEQVKFRQIERLVEQCDTSMMFLIENIPSYFEDMKLLPLDKWNITTLIDKLIWLRGNIISWNKVFESISCYAVTPIHSLHDLDINLKHANVVLDKKLKLDNDLQFLQNTFGEYFCGYSTNWKFIFDALNWLEKWIVLFKGRTVPDQILDYIAEGAANNPIDLFSIKVDKMKKMISDFDTIYPQFELYFEFPFLVHNYEDIQNQRIEDIMQWMNYKIDNIDKLEGWIRYLRFQDRLIDAGLSSFLKVLLDELPSKGKFLDLFEKRFYRSWLDSIYQNEPLLYDFDADKFNDKIFQFRSNDIKSFGMNVRRIQEKLESSRGHALQSLSFRRELTILQHEIGKKKRHWPIRKLLAQTSRLALELKPCLLMSPLSVSQFLEARNIHFDVVIFDEASQIFPEDAIGSIIRANQVIIVGDRNQLPPTDFFKAGGITDEFEDDEDVEFESILDECQSVLLSIPLLWHYRSRHESLITFSNKAFYHNNLITFPSSENGDELGVKFVHVKDGIYDRGGTRTNDREAQVTAELVLEHFNKNPNRSLGVIAFSDAQAAAIRERIEELRRFYPAMESFFREDHSDEFFVKSLENVQGDERDVIFFSVGYGKTTTGNFHANFGPLTKNGGERRLNVAITRAKYHVKLISSLLPSDVPIDRTQSIGVHRLRDYMQMAIDGSIPLLTSSNKMKYFDSPFEEDVYNALVDLGYEVDSQVGCSGYRIDLAIIDPLKQNSYLLGIECDGKTYHSSKVARDRDRLRQQVLENLGWEIYRIWSQEWFKHRKYEIEKIKSLLTTKHCE